MNVFELIADSVRLAIVRQLSDSGSAPLVEIADRAGVHANTVRSHMVELETAGVVEREHAASDGPGRPQVCYRLRPGWRLPSSDMRGLGEMLAALAVRLDPTGEEIDDFGRQWGRFLSGRPDGDPVAGLPRALEQLGFDAEVVGREVRLRSCPCPLLAPDHPELICRLAEAAINGIAEADPRRLRVCSSQHDPERRTCAFQLADWPRVQAVGSAPRGRLRALPDDA